jgi:hypothetical protein
MSRSSRRRAVRRRAVPGSLLARPAAVPRGIACGFWIAALVCGCLVLGLYAWTAPRYWAAQSRVSDQRVRDLDQGLAKYLLDNRRCPPTAAALVERGYVRPSMLKDAWGSRIAWSCSEVGARVRSAGRDRIFDTADDIANVR